MRDKTELKMDLSEEKKEEEMTRKTKKEKKRTHYLSLPSGLTFFFRLLCFAATLCKPATAEGTLWTDLEG